MRNSNKYYHSVGTLNMGGAMKSFLIIMMVGVVIVGFACSDNPVSPAPDPQQQTIDSLTVVVESLRVELGHYRCLSQQMRLYMPDTARIECGI